MADIAHALATLFAMIVGLVPAHAAPATTLPEMPTFVSKDEVTVLFAGDTIFDRSVRETVEKNGGDFLFSCIDPILRRSTVIVANLEGPITPNKSKSVGSTVGAADNYVFTFPTSTAPLLASRAISILNLGNNHIMNFGANGVRSTMQALSDVHALYFGDPLVQTVASTTLKGIPLAFINYNEFERSSTASTTISQIEAAQAAGQIPVVYTHWGVEYATTSPAYLHTLAHQFVDAGATLVVGSHPHVVEDHEEYKGVPIYYSLGNFIFDQYWNDDVSHGLLLRVTFEKGGIRGVEEIPIELQHDRRTCPSL